VEEIGAEPPHCHLFPKTTVSRAHNPRLYRLEVIAPNWAQHPFFQESQKGRLDRSGHVPDLVQEERATSGIFDQPTATTLRSGERTGHMSEEFGAHQFGSQTRNIDRHKGTH